MVRKGDIYVTKALIETDESIVFPYNEKNVNNIETH